MPNAQCPMPNARCPMPNALFQRDCAKIKANLRATAKWHFTYIYRGKSMQPIRQGDVILQPLLQVEREKTSR